jgi:hypothetical protein
VCVCVRERESESERFSSCLRKSNGMMKTILPTAKDDSTRTFRLFCVLLLSTRGGSAATMLTLKGDALSNDVVRGRTKRAKKHTSRLVNTGLSQRVTVGPPNKSSA